MTAAERATIKALPWTEISELASAFGVDRQEAAALILKESNGDAWAVRFEPGWKYSRDLTKHAKANRISVATEKNCQMMSWGLTQIMGTVARELGYAGPLSQLVMVELNLYYGLKKFKACLTKHKNLDAALAAYNAGTPKKLANGKFANQSYVDRFHEHLKNIITVTG